MDEFKQTTNERYYRSYHAQAQYYIGDRSDNHIETQNEFRKHFSVYSILQDQIVETHGEIWDNINLGGIPVDYDTDNKLVYVDSSEAHTLLIGATGSKKSRLVVMPLVRILAAAGENMIISDPKAEIYRRTAYHLKEKGYCIRVINFRSPQESEGWNFLSLPYDMYLEGDIDKACEIINDVAINLIPIKSNDPYWDYSTRDLFTGLTLLLFSICKKYNLPKETINACNLLNIRIEMFSSTKTSNIKSSWYWKEAECDEMIVSKLNGTVVCPNDTMSCILSVFDQHMSCFSLHPQLIKMLSVSTFSFDDVGKEKSAIFIILPDEKTTFHKLTSIFLKQSYERFLTQVYDTCLDNRFTRRINYVLDEFSSLPMISDFPQMISASRSRNIRFHIVMQSKKQLVQKYGQETETIQSNCANWLFLYTKELELLHEISTLGGKKDNGDLIPLYRLQHLNKEMGECLILSGRLYPFYSYLADISEYDKDKYTKLPIPHLDKNFVSVSLMEEIKKIKETEQQEKIALEEHNKVFSKPDNIAKELEAKLNELIVRDTNVNFDDIG